MILTRQQLDQMQCAAPTCKDAGCNSEAITLNAACHVGKGTVAAYQHGVLTLRCAKCSSFVAEILVAPATN